MISVNAFEEKIWKLEEVRIILRLPKSLLLSCDYPYERKLGDSSTVKELFKRVKKSLSGQQIDFSLVDGNGSDTRHPTTELGSIRNSYVKNEM